MAKERTLCYHCGIESAENIFKYYDNRKQTQPRYQCGNCQNFFTMGFHGRPQGRMYAKERNVDPPELKGLHRQCRHCGVADNAPFKYYNNKNPSQPCFKCLSCGQQFQMRLMGTGEERRLVHTASHQRPPTSDRKKLGLAPNSYDDQQMQAAKDSWMPAPELGVESFPTLSVEDAEYFDFIEAGLKNESEAPPLWMPELLLVLSVEDENYFDLINSRLENESEAPPPWVPELLPALSMEDAMYLDLIESGLESESEAPPPWMPELLLALSVEDEKYLDFIEPGLENESEAPPPWMPELLPTLSMEDAMYLDLIEA